MPYRDILVLVDDKPETRLRVQAAASLAARQGALLTGLFLTSAFLHDFLVTGPYAYLPPEDIDALIQQHAAGVAQAADAGRRVFEQVAEAAGVATEWLQAEGDHDRALLSCARRFDLVAAPPAMTVSLGQHRITADRIGLASGGPVLVTPADPPTRLGRHVLVAWKDTREAARALRDAWPLIEAADTLHVLVVSPQGDAGPEGLLQRHLERHGRAANLIVDRSDDATAAQRIRSHVEELKIDLVVMGLFGRSRLQELVLGGVSRDLLRDPPAPLLMSH